MAKKTGIEERLDLIEAELRRLERRIERMADVAAGYGPDGFEDVTDDEDEDDDTVPF